ncbi:MAG: hypothetical protein H7287_07310 [Thermoleophilia bacterium]|nr:hypothetical protein [Thermoleophilia bacterium]
MNDNRERLADGTIVNPDGTHLPPLDADLMARMEAAKDEHGIIHDHVLAAEYFVALQAQNEELARQRGEAHPVEPVPEGSRVFPGSDADGELLLEPTPETFAREPGDDELGDGSPVVVVIN